MLIDTHVHLDDAKFEADREAVLQNARAAGIKVMVSIGTTLEDSRWNVDFAPKHEGVYATVGIHPEMLGKFSDSQLAEFEKLAAAPKVVAVGEVGLDYHREPFDKKEQARVFAEMIRLSLKKKLPLVIHQRDAAADTLALLRAEGGGREGGVFHCFAGNLETARGAVSLGFDIAVGGILTFPNAKELREVIKEVPMERLVLETDAPWLAPQPWRGKRNEPAFMTAVTLKVAELKGMAVADVERITTENAKRLFRI